MILAPAGAWSSMRAVNVIAPKGIDATVRRGHNNVGIIIARLRHLPEHVDLDRLVGQPLADLVEWNSGASPPRHRWRSTRSLLRAGGKTGRDRSGGSFLLTSTLLLLLSHR